MTSRWTLSAVVLCAAVLFAGAAVAQEGQDQEAMMKAYMEMMKPGPAHEMLGKMAGDWNYTLTSYENPEAPMTMSGSSTKTMIMEGRYLMEKTTGDMMGMTFNGVGYTGYDNTSKKYQSMWFDSMSTAMTMAHGDYMEGDTITMLTDHTDPKTGKTMKVKMVTKIVDENKHHFAWITMDGDKETKSMEIEYVRK